MSTYLEKLNHYRKVGYSLFYSTMAEAAGGIGIGLAAPFNWVKDTLIYKNGGNAYGLNSPKYKKEAHRRLKTRNKTYRGFNRYLKLANRINQELLMRPLANVAGAIGGTLGFAAGLVIAVIPRTLADDDKAQEAYHVTENNAYFAEIKINARTQRSMAAFVWVGLLGLAMRPYMAPISIMGRTFQGALGFAELFGISAAFAVDLPFMLKDTWFFTKKAVTFLKDTFGVAFDKIAQVVKSLYKNSLKVIKWLGTQLQNVITSTFRMIRTVVEKVVNIVSKSLNSIATQLSNGFKKVIDFISKSATFAVDQVKFVGRKIGKVLSVIKEQGLRGLIAWMKDKTFGAGLRYWHNLNAVSNTTADIRSALTNQLKNPEIKAMLIDLLFTKDRQQFKIQEIELADSFMKTVKEIAEAHYSHDSHGGIKVKLDYLDSVKNYVLALGTVDGGAEQKLKTLLKSTYRSWNAEAPKPAEAPKAPKVATPVDHLNALPPAYDELPAAPTSSNVLMFRSVAAVQDDAQAPQEAAAPVLPRKPKPSKRVGG